MAALQTLRNKPALLMSVIGGALLLFIVTLTDLNSCSRPNVEGKINGKEITYEDYEGQIREEENLEELLLGSVSDAQKDNIRQRVWYALSQGELVAREAGKLGVLATKEDVQNELAGVTMQELQQIAQMMQYGQADLSRVTYAQKIMMLMGRYVGQPSVEAYKQFLKTADQQIGQMQKQNPEVAEMYMKIKQACLYCESQMPREILQNKYWALLQQGVISNPVAAKMAFDENNTAYDVEMATVRYSSVNDKDIKVTDADLKAKYEEIKELFRIDNETRDLKVLDISVTASAKDQDNIFNQVKAIEDTLRKAQTATAVEAIMKGSKSDVNYQNVYLTKELLGQNPLLTNVGAAIDSLSIGGVTKTAVEPRNSDGEQYISTIKLVATKSTPDSMQICRLAVNTKAAADSIVTAVKAGNNLSELAKKYTAQVQQYGLKGDTAWIETKYYLDAKADKDSASTYTDICQMSAGTVAYYSVPDPQTGNAVYVVTNVLATKSPSTKYNVAVVKYPIHFTQETYNGKKRALFEFLAKNKTIEDIEKNANKNGYTLLEWPNFTTTYAMNARMNIGGEQAKEAFVWAFNEAEAGDISKVYECGKNNDQLLVICVSGINDGKYLAWDNANVKSQLETLVKQDKKAEKILEQVKNVKSIAEARKVKGAETAMQPGIAPANIAPYEPAFAGAIERTEKGKFTGAVKGSTGIIMAQVNEKKASGKTFDAAGEMQSQARKSLNIIFGQSGNIIDAIMQEAKIVDNRYKF